VAQDRQVRFGLRGSRELHRILHTHPGAACQTNLEEFVQVEDARDVPVADRRHLDDLSLDQLDALPLAQDAGPDHAVVLVHREAPSRQVRLGDHRAPSRCSPSRSGMSL